MAAKGSGTKSVRGEVVEPPVPTPSTGSGQTGFGNRQGKERGLYVHVPFCVRKCDYCDFYSLPGQLSVRERYVESIAAEANSYCGTACETLYLGGGTPSLLGPGLLEKLIGCLAKTLDLSRLLEATIEVNPDSASLEFLAAARKCGVNRISIGVQSLDDAELKAAGRIHNSSQALQAIEFAGRAGFESISADLIAGLPGQTWPSLHHSLCRITNSGISHVSLYCLSLEPGTPFAGNPPNNLPDDDVQAVLFHKATQYLKKQGFVHYEISNFAQPGYESHHNLNYWHGGEYIGLGPAAASHMAGRRYRNRPDLNAYLKNPSGIIEDVERLDAPAKASEETMLRLRLLKEGVNADEIAAKFGCDNVKPLLERLTKMAAARQLITRGSSFFIPSSRVLTANSLFAGVLS